MPRSCAAFPPLCPRARRGVRGRRDRWRRPRSASAGETRRLCLFAWACGALVRRVAWVRWIGRRESAFGRVRRPRGAGSWACERSGPFPCGAAEARLALWVGVAPSAAVGCGSAVALRGGVFHRGGVRAGGRRRTRRGAVRFARGAVLRLGLAMYGAAPGSGRRCARRIATWLILPVVICLSQRLSHACVSINSFVL